MSQKMDIVMIDIVTKNINNYVIKNKEGEYGFDFLAHENINESQKEYIKNSFEYSWEETIIFNNWEDQILDLYSYNEDSWEYNIFLEISNVWWDILSWFSAAEKAWDKINLYFSDYCWAAAIAKFSNQNIPSTEVYFDFDDFEYESFIDKNIVFLKKPEIFKNKEVFNQFQEMFEMLYWEWDYYSNESEYIHACQKMESIEEN